MKLREMLEMRSIEIGPDTRYTYDILVKDIRELRAGYPFLETGAAGHSVLGRRLYYLRLGEGPMEVFYNAAHHSLEWITAPLCMKFAENFLKAYSTGTDLRGYDIRKLWKRASIYIMPMVNPDGVNLVLNSLTQEHPHYNQILLWNRTGKPVSQVWNSNIRGVDLNRNYPAAWEKGKAQEKQLEVYGPGPTRYGGPAPLSEPETQAVVNFTRQHNFQRVIALHSQGRVIYWTYQNMTPSESLAIARAFSEASGYEAAMVPDEAAFAGYKDWFIQEYQKPGFTLEVGLGRNPLPITQFEGIYEEIEEILLLAPTLGL